MIIDYEYYEPFFLQLRVPVGITLIVKHCIAISLIIPSKHVKLSDS